MSVIFPRRSFSYIGHRVREIAVWADAVTSWRQGKASPSVMFFPSSTAEGASLLRAYAIAQQLCTHHNWSTVVVPMQLEERQRRRLIRVLKPDLLFFQQCRHPLNRRSFTYDRPYVLDIDDADFFDPSMHDHLVEMARDARGVIAGSRFIQDWAKTHNTNVETVWTGTPISDRPAKPHADRRAVVAWAQSTPSTYPAELDFVRQVYSGLKARGVEFSLRLYGVKSAAERQALMAALGADEQLETFPYMPYNDFLRSLEDVAVGLSPIKGEAVFSRGKSFGKILGYLQAHVPVIASDEADHADFFKQNTGIVSNDLEEWVAGAKRLLANPALRDQMSAEAFTVFQNHLTTSVAADKIARFCADAAKS